MSQAVEGVPAEHSVPWPGDSVKRLWTGSIVPSPPHTINASTDARPRQRLPLKATPRDRSQRLPALTAIHFF